MGRKIAIIVLAAATAAIHLALGVQIGGALFILNGLGYLALAAALYLPALRPYQRWTRWALIGYTALTIIAWLAIGQASTIAYLDKAIEAALIVLLLADSQS